MADDTQAPEDRWKTIKQLWRNERFFYQMLGGLVLVGIGVWIGALIFDGENRTSYWMNGYTEVLSIGITVFVLNLLAQRREEQREIERLKADLIRRMGSQVRETAVSAVNELSKRGWLQDGTLSGASLSFANLQGAIMANANLQKAILGNVNLQKAYLEEANLQEATLMETNLQGADLSGANLKGTILDRVNLQGADLKGARLHGACLSGSDLQGANLEGAGFSDKTILPDARVISFRPTTFSSYWSPSTDMARFTNPHHPKFWQSDLVERQND